MFTTKEYIVHFEIWKQLVNDIGYNKAGTYKVRCFADDQKSYRATSRLLGQDTDGVLYIGSARKCLITRILKLRTSLCSAANNGFANTNAHQCGKKYSSAIQAQFPFKDLCVTIYPVPHDYTGDAEDIEVTESRSYENKFGEVPPLNDVHPKARWRPHEQI